MSTPPHAASGAATVATTLGTPAAAAAAGGAAATDTTPTTTTPGVTAAATATAAVATTTVGVPTILPWNRCSRWVCKRKNIQPVYPCANSPACHKWFHLDCYKELLIKNGFVQDPLAAADDDAEDGIPRVACTKKCLLAWHKKQEESHAAAAAAAASDAANTDEQESKRWTLDGLGGKDDPVNSMSILLQWWKQEGNYANFRDKKNRRRKEGGGVTKLQQAKMVASQMKGRVRFERNAKQVIYKIKHTEDQWEKAHEFVTSDVGMQMKVEDEKQWREHTQKICPHYFDLYDIMIKHYHINNKKKNKSQNNNDSDDDEQEEDEQEDNNNDHDNNNDDEDRISVNSHHDRQQQQQDCVEVDLDNIHSEAEEEHQQQQHMHRSKSKRDGGAAAARTTPQSPTKKRAGRKRKSYVESVSGDDDNDNDDAASDCKPAAAATKAANTTQHTADSLHLDGLDATPNDLNLNNNNINNNRGNFMDDIRMLPHGGGFWDTANSNALSKASLTELIRHHQHMELIENKKLTVEQEKMEIEKEKVTIEKKKVTIENERVTIEKRRVDEQILTQQMERRKVEGQVLVQHLSYKFDLVEKYYQLRSKNMRNEVILRIFPEMALVIQNVDNTNPR